MRLIYFFMMISFLGTLDAADGPIQPVTTDLPPAELPGRAAADPNLAALDALIVATEQTLATQRKVRQMVSDYFTLRAEYTENQQNKQLIVRLVKMATGLLEVIQANHLADAFDADFMHELTFFSQIASKKSRP